MRLVTVALLLLTLPLGASAHHSNAEYDRSVIREFAGEVVRVRWSNPHIQVTLRTEREDGVEALLIFEGQDLNSLGRRAVPRDVIQVGDSVRVVGNPSSRRAELFRLHSVLLPRGTEVLMREGVEPRWSDDYIGGGGWVVQDGGEEEVRGIFRTWTKEDGVTPEVLNDPPLTPSARIAYAAFDPVVDDPAINCVPPGMPRVMTRSGPHPIEFVQQGSDIVMRLEFFDLVRVIHMDWDVDPDDQPATPLGYSRGRWEGRTLVVETTRVSWPLLTVDPLVGAPQSEAVEIIERFTLAEDESEMIYDVTVTDPVTLTEPIAAPGYLIFLWQPGVKVEPYQCTVG